jgi:hypothetical protein
MVLFVRIDDRLIHGQVVEGWVNYLKATRILVADDRVAANALQRSIMEIAVPQGLTVSIGGIDEICSQVRAAGENERAICCSRIRRMSAGAQVRSGASRSIWAGYVPGNASSGCPFRDDADIASLRHSGLRIAVHPIRTDETAAARKVFEARSLS